MLERLLLAASLCHSSGATHGGGQPRVNAEGSGVRGRGTHRESVGPRLGRADAGRKGEAEGWNDSHRLALRVAR